MQSAASESGLYNIRTFRAQIASKKTQKRSALATRLDVPLQKRVYGGCEVYGK